jgi:hypothetical protein
MHVTSLPQRIRDVVDVIGKHTSVHEAIPGDRVGQIAVLAESELFASINLAALTDAQVGWRPSSSPS